MLIDANLFIVYTRTIILGDFLGLHMGYINFIVFMLVFLVLFYKPTVSHCPVRDVFFTSFLS